MKSSIYWRRPCNLNLSSKSKTVDTRVLALTQYLNDELSEDLCKIKDVIWCQRTVELRRDIGHSIVFHRYAGLSPTRSGNVLFTKWRCLTYPIVVSYAERILALLSRQTGETSQVYSYYSCLGWMSIPFIRVVNECRSISFLYWHKYNEVTLSSTFS